MLEALRGKNLHLWLGDYARSFIDRERRAATTLPRHLLFAFCDHFEPLWGHASFARGEERVRAWGSRYPVLAQRYRDADGLHPRHSFFFPGEQYAPELLEPLAVLTRAGLGEVELHLHHDGDSATHLRLEIARYLAAYMRHGLLSRDGEGRPRYGFIHGNWCLANARGDGRWCGVDEEVSLLFETGCYADFTFPSAPDASQPHRINQIYWPTGNLRRRRSYESGERARVGRPRSDRILLIEGPLALARRRGHLLPRIESAAVTAADPASPARVRTWVSQRIHVEGRPEWVFVKVHTHGAPETQAESLLGAGGDALHRELTTRYNDGHRFILHYVTAREMFNIARAAIDGKTGAPGDYRDYLLPPPPASPRRSACPGP